MNTIVKDELSLLAEQIKAAFNRREHSRADMVAETMTLASKLLEAREHFRGDTEFGRWCSEVGLPIPKNERMALLAFAREPERATSILASTKSNSIQMIYTKEFRIPSARKAANPKTDKARPKTDAALAAYDELKAAGVEPTRGQVMQKAGVTDHPAQLAITIRKAEEAAASEGADISTLGKTAKEKAEAAVRKIQKKLELDYDQRLQAAVRKHITEFVMPMYAEKLELADRVLATAKKPFTIEEYRKLLGALHPDSSSPERRQEMFILVKSREALLRPPEKDKPLSGDLPKTIEELLARRKKK